VGNSPQVNPSSYGVVNQYSSDEDERLMKTLAEHGEHVVGLVELALEVGMGLGELLHARWRGAREG
jgi:hypothetical protein